MLLIFSHLEHTEWFFYFLAYFLRMNQQSDNTVRRIMHDKTKIV